MTCRDASLLRTLQECRIAKCQRRGGKPLIARNAIESRTMVWMCLSATPFDCGEYGELVTLALKPYLRRICSISAEFNSLPPSV